MPMTIHRARKIAKEIVKAEKNYTGIAKDLGLNSRQALYERLQNPIVKKEIAKFSEKIASVDELKEILTNAINKVNTFVENNDLSPENAVLFDKLLKSIELHGRFQGAFVEKVQNVNVNIDMSSEEINKTLENLMSGDATVG